MNAIFVIFAGMHDHDRKADGEGCTLSLAGTINPNGTAMQFHKMVNNCETKTQTAMLSSTPTFCLPEAVKDIRQKVGPNSLPCVAHNNFDVRVDPFESDLHTPALGRKIDRVGEEIPQDLLQPGGVAGDRTGVRVDHGLDSDSLCLGGRGNGANSRLDDRRESHRTDVKAKLPCDDA